MDRDELRRLLDEATPRPWVVPGANVFRVIAPIAPHRNRPIGKTPPYPWQVVADPYPGGDPNAADAALIAAAVNALPQLLDAADEAEARAHNAEADYDRRGERLWRLAALAGWTPGNPADNDATAELYVSDALAEADRLRARLTALEDGLRAWRERANSAALEDWQAHNEAADMGDTNAADVHGAAAEVGDGIVATLRALLDDPLAGDEGRGAVGGETC